MAIFVLAILCTAPADLVESLCTASIGRGSFSADFTSVVVK